MQNNKMPKSDIYCILYGDLGGCRVYRPGSRYDPLIVVPAALASAYLAYAVACWTILKPP